MKKVLKRFLSCVLMLSFLVGMIATTAAAAEEKTGTFTVTSMNVDGLPQTILGITINGDGPDSAGTKKISDKMSSYGWDIIGVSEDFNFNTELMSGLTNYSSGTYRGGVSGLTNNTDGLNLIWKKTFSVTGETITSWNTHYGYINNGADGMIDKGYRYYAVTIEEGITVDVYILHMDADSDAGDISARESQLTQLADAIKASDNGNPIIVMGDTNCRYTRENLQTLFIDAINKDSRFTIQDVWIEKVREGDYPVHGADAIVAKDKGGTYDYPDAEIVDKVFYINNTDSKVQLTANSYTIATDFVDTDGTALADHWPVVVEFGYKVEEKACEHEYQISEEKQATCTEEGSVTYKCSKCGDTYSQIINKKEHDYQAVVTEPTCTEAGFTTYTCKWCDDTYKANGVPASGHEYVDGVCSVCGDKKESTSSENKVLGAETKKIVSGNSYVLALNGSTGVYALGRTEDGIIKAEKIKASEGTDVSEALVWTITEEAGGYTISIETDNGTKYLAKSKKYTGYGYKVELQNEKFVWSVSTDNNLGSLRFYTKAGYGSTYYLRYYNERQGWIATTRAAGLKLYQVE